MPSAATPVTVRDGREAYSSFPHVFIKPRAAAEIVMGNSLTDGSRKTQTTAL